MVSQAEGVTAAAKMGPAPSGSTTAAGAASSGRKQSQSLASPATTASVSGSGRGRGGDVSLRSSMVASTSQPSSITCTAGGGAKALGPGSMRQASPGPTRASAPGSLRRSLGPDTLTPVQSREGKSTSFISGPPSQWDKGTTSNNSGWGLMGSKSAEKPSRTGGRAGSEDIQHDSPGTLLQYNIARPAAPSEQQQQMNIGRYKRSSSVPRSSESSALLKLKEQQSMQRWQRQQQLQPSRGSGCISSSMYYSESGAYHAVSSNSSAGNGAVVQIRESVVGSRGLTAAARLSRGPGSPHNEMGRWSLES
jgi:hypothetical protein